MLEYRLHRIPEGILGGIELPYCESPLDRVQNTTPGIQTSLLATLTFRNGHTRPSPGRLSRRSRRPPPHPIYKRDCRLKKSIDMVYGGPVGYCSKHDGKNKHRKRPVFVLPRRGHVTRVALRMYRGVAICV